MTTQGKVSLGLVALLLPLSIAGIVALVWREPPGASGTTSTTILEIDSDSLTHYLHSGNSGGQNIAPTHGHRGVGIDGTLRLLGIWHRVIHLFYNGRLLTLFRVGQVVRETWPGRMVDWHFRKHMPKIFTGEDVGNSYSYRLVQFMAHHALAGNDPEELRIL